MGKGREDQDAGHESEGSCFVNALGVTSIHQLRRKGGASCSRHASVPSEPTTNWPFLTTFTVSLFWAQLERDRPTKGRRRAGT